MTTTHETTSFRFYSRETLENRAKQTAVEAEIMLSVNGEDWLSFRCSPENIEALAVGFLFTSAFLETAEAVASVSLCDGGQNVDVWLHHAAKKPDHWSRTSGCQGGAIQSGPEQGLKRVMARETPISAIFDVVDTFLSILLQKDRSQNGVHTSALFDQGETILVSDDIGRHNTLDKIAGECLLRKIPLQEPVLVTTGRISSEMIYKAARMNVGLVISLHSTSSMAIGAAESLGITLAGHARRGQLEVYTHPECIVSS